MSRNPANLSSRIIRTGVNWSNAGMSLLGYLTSRFTYRTGSEWEERIFSGEITVNQKTVSPQYQLQINDIIEYHPQDIAEPPADLNYRIVYEDDALLVIDKPGNLCVHPAGPFFKHTLWHLLCSRFGKIHLVSRLDRETSGLLIAAKTPEVANCLQTADHRQLRKTYLALVHGVFDRAVDADGYLLPDHRSIVRKKRRFSTVLPVGETAAETAHTQLEPVTTAFGRSLVRAIPFTGRMHQIRATLFSLGYPVCGDKLYGVNEEFYLKQRRDELTDDDRKALLIGRQALHSAELTFRHPVSQKMLSFTSPLPPELSELLRGAPEETA